MAKLDPGRAGRYARAHFSGALMSDTKWRKLIAALAKADPGLRQMQVKFIDVDEPRLMAFPPGLGCPRPYIDTVEFGPVELRAIEWLEFPAIARLERGKLPALEIAQQVDAIEATLRSMGRYPVRMTGSGVRIVGYTR
jgi:uncharacterized protein DUF6678